MSSENGASSTRAQLLQAIRETDRFLLTTHERPDGDAIGSLTAMQLVLSAIGKDSLAFVAADEFPLPYEYRFLHLEGLVTEPPPDLCERVLVFLDCGNIDRTSAAQLKHEDHRILNIDHHHDNTRFGTINYVDGSASCTAEMVWDLMLELGVALTPAIGEALYVGLVTDTGRFMYDNTGPRAHEMAAALLQGGVDGHGIFRRLYEGMPQGKLELLARGLTHVQRFDGGLLTVTHLTLEDYRADGRRRELLRGRRGPPALRRGHGGRRARARPADRRARRAARSPCAPPTAASTSRRSPARWAAAGTDGRPGSRPTWTSRSSSTSCAPSSPASFEPTGSSWWTSRPGSPPMTWWPGCGASSTAASRSGMPARWTRSRPACCWCSSAVPRACSAS